MDTNKVYRSLISHNSSGLALHRIIRDEEGLGIDYRFELVNERYEEITGLNRKEIEGKTIKEVLGDEMANQLGWITLFSEVADAGQIHEFEQYSSPRKRWYSVKVFSPDKDLFFTEYRETTHKMNEEQTVRVLLSASEMLIQSSEDVIDYSTLVETARSISQARYAILNLLKEPDDRYFVTKAVTGYSKDRELASEILGTSLIGYQWKNDSLRHMKVNENIVSSFPNLSSLLDERISNEICEKLSRLFSIERIQVVRITDNNKTVGDFTLLYEKGSSPENDNLVKIYAHQVGMFLNRKKTEQTLKTRLRYERSLQNLSRVLLSNSQGEESLKFALSYLKQGADSHFIRLYRCLHNPGKGLCFQLIYAPDETLPGIAFEEEEVFIPGFKDWFSALKDNEPLMGEQTEMIKIKYLPEKQSYHFILLPIRIEGKSIGFITLINYSAEKKWKPDDLNLLQTAAEITGNYLERMNREGMINEQREQFMLAVKGSNDGIWDWDISNNSVYFSERWKEILGYRNHEFPNQIENYLSAIHPDDNQYFMNQFVGYLEGKLDKFNTEFRMLHKDGSVKWIQSRAEVLKDEKGKPIRMSGSHTDITHRKEQEKLMAAFSSIVENSDNFISVKDLNQRFIAANSSLVSEFGFSNFKMMEGKTEQELLSESKASDSLTRKIEDERDALEMSAGNILVREEKMEYLTGDKRVYLRKTYPVFNNKGEKIGTGTISTDISQQKKAQEKAEAANKAKSEFIANMSHEIRTPLNGVIGFSTLLKDTGLDEKQTKFVDNALSSARQLLSIINAILDFSKIEANKMEIDEEMTDIRHLLNECSNILAHNSLNHVERIVTRLPEDLPDRIRLDPLRIKQVLLNLLGNALKFSEEKQVILEVEVSYVNEKEADFLFSVEDKGIGIPDEVKARLFNAFSQADGSTTRRYGGTGLGLVISDSLIKNMGSKIELETHEGEGSRFYFTLRRPFSRKKTPRKKNELNIHNVFAGLSNRTLHFLLVDDVKANLIMLEAMIKRILPESQLSKVDNGREAVDQYEKNNPDLIFMDLQMPEMDGFSATQEIRRREKEKQEKAVPIIALTAAASKEIKQKCFDFGMNDYLTKPVLPDHISSILNKYFDLGLSEDESREKNDDSLHFDRKKLLNRLNNSQEAFSKLRKGFLQQLDADMEELKDKTGKDKNRIAHRLKGTALNVCCPRLHKLSYQLEKGIFQNNKEEEILIDKIIKEAETLKKLFELY